MTPNSRSEGTRWIAQADRDIEDARLLSDNGRHNLACFMSQQAGEKAIKGYLYHHGAEDVWGISLADLCEDASVVNRMFDVIKSQAVLLDKYYLVTRYPHVLPSGLPSDAYDSIDSDRAIHIAREVIEFVRVQLMEE